MRTLLLVFCCMVSMIIADTSQSLNPLPPGKVEVLPVYFVPEGGVGPTQDQIDKMMTHLIWSQSRYSQMLKERSTFTIADRDPLVFFGEKPDDFYQAEEDRGAGAYANELLNYLDYTRFNCPYIFVVLYMNPNPNNTFPRGAGRPMNAGFNTGGGLVIMSSHGLNHSNNFQSTLQHELGHTFGLTHVDAFGYDMATNESIMSYNRDHWTNDFTPSLTPGILIPEDIRGLALNKLVFPELYFDPETDIPGDYTIHPDIKFLGAFTIPDQPGYAIEVTTNANAAYNTRNTHIVQGEIRPNGPAITDPLEVRFHNGSMYHSPNMGGQRIMIDLLFPIPVTLDQISLHSQHSGFIHPTESIEIGVLENGYYKSLVNKAVTSADQWFKFEANTSNYWRVYLKPGETGFSVVRGMQFYYQDNDIFPPYVPYNYQNPFLNQLPSQPDLFMPMNHETISETNVNMGWSGDRADEYRLQVDTTILFNDPMVNTVVQTESYLFDAPNDNKKYYWRVKGLNNVANGFGVWSALNDFDIDPPSGIQDFSGKNITVYPNPSSGSFFISSEEIIHEIHIMDMLGRKVYSAKPEQTQIYYSLEMPGVYFINLTTSNGVQTHKLIIINQ